MYAFISSPCTLGLKGCRSEKHGIGITASGFLPLPENTYEYITYDIRHCI